VFPKSQLIRPAAVLLFIFCVSTFQSRMDEQIRCGMRQRLLPDVWRGHDGGAHLILLAWHLVRFVPSTSVRWEESQQTIRCVTTSKITVTGAVVELLRSSSLAHVCFVPLKELGHNLHERLVIGGALRRVTTGSLAAVTPSSNLTYAADQLSCVVGTHRARSGAGCFEFDSAPGVSTLYLRSPLDSTSSTLSFGTKHMTDVVGRLSNRQLSVYNHVDRFNLVRFREAKNRSHTTPRCLGPLSTIISSLTGTCNPFVSHGINREPSSLRARRHQQLLQVRCHIRRDRRDFSGE
jgi:hypothetical protein